MRGIVALATKVARSWLGVHVGREHNTDCDRLSHPDQVGSVVAAAVQAGLHVHEVTAPRDVMAQLERLIHDSFDAE